MRGLWVFAGYVAGFASAVLLYLWLDKKDEEAIAEQQHESCSHNSVLNLSTFGEQKFRCRLCGLESPVPFPSTN